MTKSKLEKGLLKGLVAITKLKNPKGIAIYKFYAGAIIKTDTPRLVEESEYRKLKKDFDRMKAIYDELQHVRMK